MSETSQPNADVTPDVAHKYDSELASPPIQREIASLSAVELKAGAADISRTAIIERAVCREPVGEIRSRSKSRDLPRAIPQSATT